MVPDKAPQSTRGGNQPLLSVVPEGPGGTWRKNEGRRVGGSQWVIDLRASKAVEMAIRGLRCGRPCMRHAMGGRVCVTLGATNLIQGGGREVHASCSHCKIARPVSSVIVLSLMLPLSRGTRSPPCPEVARRIPRDKACGHVPLERGEREPLSFARRMKVLKISKK